MPNVNNKITTPANPHHPIPTRSRQANPYLVDLTDYYTAALDDDWFTKPGANLKSLDGGIQCYAKVAFDVRGLIQLAGTGPIKDTGIAFPRAVTGIKVQAIGRKLHFLQGTAWSAPEDTRIGTYVLHYTNGQTQHIPIVYQRHVRDWWIHQADPLPTNSEIAWHGENDASQRMGYSIQIYKYTVNNPFPEVQIETIDFTSDMTESAPFLIGLTLEPINPNHEISKMAQPEHMIPARSEKATPGMVDLTNVYCHALDDEIHAKPGNTLSELPHGLQRFNGIPFDARGVIQLAGSHSLAITGVVYPEAARGIPAHGKGRRLHFLHAAAWAPEDGKTQIGRYVLHYANGESRSIPIIFQENVADWWVRPNDIPPVHAEVAWEGVNPRTKSMSFLIRLYHYTVENPLPEAEIQMIDFISEMVQSAPLLVAITIE